MEENLQICVQKQVTPENKESEDVGRQIVINDTVI